MKISTLLETPTTSVGTNDTQAPKFGRSDKVLERDNTSEKVEEMSTTSGAIGSVATPMPGMQRRAKGSMFSGIKTSKKFPNSVAESSLENNIEEIDTSIAQPGATLTAQPAAASTGYTPKVGDEVTWRHSDPMSKMMPLPGTVLAVAPGKVKLKIYSKRMIQDSGKDTIVLDLNNYTVTPKQGVAEAGNKPVEKSYFGMGDTRSPRDIKSQMSGASDEFVRTTADSKTGPFHSKVARMQGKMAKSELRKREQGVAEASFTAAASMNAANRKQSGGKTAQPTHGFRVGDQVTTRDGKKGEVTFVHGNTVHVKGTNDYYPDAIKHYSSKDLKKGMAEGFDSAAFDRHMDKLRAQKELEKTDPMRAMVNKMKSDDDYKEKSKSKSKQDGERQITDPFHPSQGVNIGEQGVAEGDDMVLDEKSKSKAQFRMMAAVANNPKFAKKVGISPKVGKEFHSADKKSDYKSLPKKVDEAEISEEQILAKKLQKQLDMFKKGPDHDLGNKPKNRDIGNKPSDREVQQKKMSEATKEADYGPEYQDMVKRVGEKAKQGPMKTVWDEKTRKYKVVPVNAQPNK